MLRLTHRLKKLEQRHAVEQGVGLRVVVRMLGPKNREGSWCQRINGGPQIVFLEGNWPEMPPEELDRLIAGLPDKPPSRIPPSPAGCGMSLSGDVR